MAADNSNPAFRHGHSPKKGKSLTYRTWRSMMQRCYRIKEKSYDRYGARGISVCDRWHDFKNFLADMGEKPAILTLDRINSEGNYEPSNCRWASTTTQARNRSNTVKLSYLGETLSVAEWAERTGINYNCLRRRLSIGWTARKILTTRIMTIQEVSALGLAKRWAQTL